MIGSKNLENTHWIGSPGSVASSFSPKKPEGEAKNPSKEIEKIAQARFSDVNHLEDAHSLCKKKNPEDDDCVLMGEIPDRIPLEDIDLEPIKIDPKIWRSAHKANRYGAFK